MRVEVKGPAPAEAWDVLRQFAVGWHPWITQMQEKPGGVRVFQVNGEDTVYRERLTWHSDTLQEIAYTHIQGIDGADRYDAQVRIVAGEVIWHADIEGPRAAQIADGTKTVFEAGIAALPDITPRADPELPTKPHRLEQVFARNHPRLAMTKTDGGCGTPVLFLHGIGGGRSNWIGQMGAGRHPTAALDLRGYGDSALGDKQSTIEDHCDDILAAMSALEAEQVILCGLSFGAWIATSFAMRHPEKLAGLVLAGGCTGMSEASETERAAFLASREVPLAAGQTPADFAPRVVDVIAGPEASDAQRSHLHASMAAITSETYADALRLFTNPPEVFDFSKITMPVMLMTGAHDKLAPPAEIQNVARRIWRQSPEPNVRFEVLQNAGHVCNVEAPERFDALLAAFCRMIDP